MFMCTPHRGGKGVLLEEVTTNILRMTGFSIKRELISDLIEDSMSLSEQNRSFIHAVNTSNMRIKSFYEQDQMPKHRCLVTAHKLGRAPYSLRYRLLIKHQQLLGAMEKI